MDQFRIDQTALVLEGGGMRGAFTAGVLDLFMDKGLLFPYSIGVSGGTNNGLSYFSRQRGRSYYAHVTLMKEQPYIGIRPWLKKKMVIDLDLLYEELVHTLYPYDFAAAFSNPGRFEVVATHCITGEAHYLEERTDAKRLLTIGRASCSLPILSPEVWVDGQPMTDGGLADSIPLKRAFGQGFSKAVVVLTQNEGFRKPPSKFKVPSFILPRYPKVREMLYNRPARYNAQLEWVEQMEREGAVDIIRPLKPLEVGRLTTDYRRLQRLYDEGYENALTWYNRYHPVKGE